MKRVACGVLVFDGAGALLLCHLTGTPYWDLPKGLAEADETEREAAVREIDEECGVALAPEALLELGRFAYRPGKDLHLFAARRADAGTLTLTCRSHFVDRRGRTRPEVDAYRWVPPAEVASGCAPSLVRVLRQIDLAGLAARLASATVAADGDKSRGPGRARD